MGNSPITCCHLPKNALVIAFTILHLIRKLIAGGQKQWKKEFMINDYGWVSGLSFWASFFWPATFTFSITASGDTYSDGKFS